MNLLAEGSLDKMQAALKSPVEYHLPIGDAWIALNPLLGQKIQLRYSGVITCVYCEKPTKKSFNQGYCYRCFLKLARCDTCIMSPEKCHYANGTCREPTWGEQHCLTEHSVYLANTSAAKVGITRASQIPTRWIDQGAVQALPIFSVTSRYYSGLIEQLFRAHVADKTQWQAMLKGQIAPLDLLELRDQLVSVMQDSLGELQRTLPINAITAVKNLPVVAIDYPVLRYPDKVKSLDFDKQPVIEGVLNGIKGQYLLLNGRVLNIRKFTAYRIGFSVG